MLNSNPNPIVDTQKAVYNMDFDGLRCIVRFEEICILLKNSLYL